MADANAVPASPKRHRWLRVLGWVVGVLIVLLVIFYFVATSSAFFKGVILPRVSRSMNAKVTVTDASIHPFSYVVLRGLKVQTTGPEPLLTAQEARLRYSLRDILGGNMKIDEITVASPTVFVVQNPDGSSNLDPLTKKTEAKPSQPRQAPAPPSQPPPPSGKPPQVDLKQMAINNATVVQVTQDKNGGRQQIAISNLNFTVNGVKNGQAGTLDVSADLRMDQTQPKPGTNGQLQAKLNGKFNFDLSPALQPTVIKGDARLAVEQASGSLSDLAALAANLNCDITPTDIKQVAMRFQKGTTPLGQILASGPFDMAKKEGRVKVEVLNIDRNVLNLAGASHGMDFGQTVINSTNQVDVAKAGNLVTVNGRLNVTPLSITQSNQTTPPLDLRAMYDLTVDQPAKVANLRTFTVTGTQNQRPLLFVEVPKPMSVTWATNATQALPDSELHATVTNLNLADWKPFVGDLASAGNVGMTFKLTSQQSGKQLGFDLVSQIQGLTAKFGSNQLNQADVNLQARGQVANMRQVNLGEYRLQLARQNQPMLVASGSGQFDKDTKDADLNLTGEATLNRLLAALPQPDMSASSGTAQIKAHVVQKQNAQNVTGTLALANFTGAYGSYKFDNYGATMDFDVANSSQQMEIRKLAGALRQGNNPGGNFEVTGNYDTNKQAGAFDLKLAGFNQNGLRPFLAPSLGDKQLVSVALNGAATARYAAKGESVIKGNLQMTDLVVNDPKKTVPATPLEAKIQLDSSLNNKVLDLRQLELALTPTQRAKNVVQVAGKVDATQTNAITGALKLQSEAMDVTPYYDLFAAKPAEAGKAPAKPEQPAPAKGAAPAPGGAPAPAPSEPPPKTLPFRNFTADANIGHFYLREIDIANLLVGVKLDGSQVTVKPLQMAINGGPVDGAVALNLGVPGYHYDIALKMSQVPVAPLADTFSPEYRGRAQGQLNANAQIQGTGTTGASLQKTLQGQANLSLTNATIQVTGSRGKLIINTIATALRLQELLQSPVNSLALQSTMGNGQINLAQFNAKSEAFIVSSQGSIPIADVLTNSPLPNLPVNVALRRNVAEKSRLLPPNTPPDADYVPLPTFVHLAGTIGNPKPEVNKVVLAELTAKSLRALPGGVESGAGKIIQGLPGIGGAAGGGQPAPGPSTPPAPSKPSGGFNPFDLLKPKK